MTFFDDSAMPADSTEAEDAPEVEFISLADDRTVTLYVEGEDGKHRVFYDLDALFAQYAQPCMAQGLLARLTDDSDMLSEVRGQATLLEGIRQSIDALRLEADFLR